MEKVLVNIYVPILGTSYDIFVPLQSKIHEITTLINKAVSELSEGLFIPDAKTTLCMRDTGNIINVNLSVYEAGFKNGTKLILI